MTYSIHFCHRYIGFISLYFQLGSSVVIRENGEGLAIARLAAILEQVVHNTYNVRSLKIVLFP